MAVTSTLQRSDESANAFKRRLVKRDFRRSRLNLDFAVAHRAFAVNKEDEIHVGTKLDCTVIWSAKLRRDQHAQVLFHLVGFACRVDFAGKCHLEITGDFHR